MKKGDKVRYKGYPKRYRIALGIGTITMVTSTRVVVKYGRDG